MGVNFINMFTCNTIGAFMNISVRNVDVKVFYEFKVKTVSRGMKAGTAMTQALLEWNQKESNTKTEKGFFELKPRAWGAGTEKTSIEADKVLYGGKK
jgi:hypothetical protein